MLAETVPPVVMPDRMPTLRVVPMPSDANQSGDIFGGWIMSQVDIAGGIADSRRACGRVVTVSVDSFVFKHPVFVGDVLSFFTEILRVGRTSIRIDVSVFAERNPVSPCIVKVTEAVLTYVAVNQQGEKREVPSPEK